MTSGVFIGALFASLAFLWGIDAAIEPSSIGLPHWLHAIVAIFNGLIMAALIWRGRPE